MKKLCKKCQAIVRQNETERKRAYRMKLRSKNQQKESKVIIDSKNQIEYNEVLKGLKESAIKKHKKTGLDDLFAK